jgi:choloylglycine hydrolase
MLFIFKSPDGGINEAGLYIWEMSEDADYAKNDSLPKLNQRNWIFPITRIS